MFVLTRTHDKFGPAQLAGPEFLLTNSPEK